MKRTFLMGMMTLAASALWAQGEPAKSSESTPAKAEVKNEIAVTVEKMVVAAGVENREPVGEAKGFDASAGKIFCWMKVTAKEVPATVKHVWYLDGKQVAEVPLKIGYPSMRTWSSKTVAPGNWKVEAANDSGVTLGVVEFTVGGGEKKSGASAPAPEKK